MVIVAVLASAALIGAWVVALRAHLGRTSADTEWDGAEERPHLWTSAARCLHCGGAGGVVDEHDGHVFICLRCGRRRERRTR